jgi:hypothetical protein
MKKLPPTLLAALGLDILVTAVGALLTLVHSMDSSVRVQLAFNGVDIVTYVLGIAGFVELARRRTGIERTGLHITIGAFALGIATMVFWQIVTFVQPHWSDHTWTLLSRWGYLPISFLPTFGLVIASSRRNRRGAAAAFVLLLVAAPIPPVAQKLYGWIGGWRAMVTVEDVMHISLAVAMLLLSTLLSDGEPARNPEEATSGLRTIASALWLRVIAAVTVTGLTLMLMMGSAGEGSVGILKLAMFSGAIVNAISFVMLAYGALAAVRSAVPDLPRWPVVAAAAGATWCLGVVAYQLPYTYRLLYGSHDYGFASGPQEYVQALSLAVPLVATGAIAVIAAAIGGFAGRRGLEQLRADAQAKGAGFVGLMLASIAIEAWLLPKADALWATVLMARLCATAAESLNADPPLPTAKVI